MFASCLVFMQVVGCSVCCNIAVLVAFVYVGFWVFLGFYGFVVVATVFWCFA